MMNYLQKKIYNLKHNKKGSMAIEIVIGMMIFITVLSFMTDLTTIMWKFASVSQANTVLARTVGIEGGISYSAPANYPGTYYSNSYMYNLIKKQMNDAGIQDSDWTATVNGQSLQSANVVVPYMGDITTKVTFNYKFTLLSNFISALANKSTLTSTRSTVSEFMYHDGQMIGE